MSISVTYIISASCPSRGTWIEMAKFKGLLMDNQRRAPRGARGLKCRIDEASQKLYCRAPRGARGLKFGSGQTQGANGSTSCPSRGTWIEMDKSIISLSGQLSCPSRGTWIEIPRR